MADELALPVAPDQTGGGPSARAGRNLNRQRSAALDERERQLDRREAQVARRERANNLRELAADRYEIDQDLYPGMDD